MLSLKKVVLITFAFFISGCLISQIASFDEYTKGWIGEPIGELQEIHSRPGSYVYKHGGVKKTYSLSNGNWIYVVPHREECLIHWEVNPKGIIVGYRTEGGGCH